MTNVIAKVDAASLVREIQQHAGMIALHQLGETLLQQPLFAHKRLVFFASLWSFFKNVPVGITHLAVRLMDAWAERLPWQATTIASYILLAGYDELGGEHGMTHHQLFANLLNHFQLATSDVLNVENILPEALTFADLYQEFYRQKPLPQALGFHLASEITSNEEFNLFYNAFLKHASIYGFKGATDPLLELFRVHTVVEPQHGQSAVRAIQFYLDQDVSYFSEVCVGVDKYLNAYQQLFAALNYFLKSS